MISDFQVNFTDLILPGLKLDETTSPSHIIVTMFRCMPCPMERRRQDGPEYDRNDRPDE